MPYMSALHVALYVCLVCMSVISRKVARPVWFLLTTRSQQGPLPLFFVCASALHRLFPPCTRLLPIGYMGGVYALYVCMPYMYALYVCRTEYMYTVCVYLICMPYMYALYVCLMCTDNMPAYVCLICMPQRVHVCLMCMAYMYAVYVCLICMPYMYDVYACQRESDARCKQGGRALCAHWQRSSTMTTPRRLKTTRMIC